MLGLGTGLRALLSAQTALDTIGHNIANAQTPGYSRQRVDLVQAMPANVRGMLVGQGVDVGRISRSVDGLLQRRILSQVSVAGSLDAQLSHMSEVETFFGEPADSSIGALLDGFFARMTDLSGSPGDGLLKTGAVQAGSELSSRIRDLSGTLSELGGSVGGELRANVDAVNQLAREVASLNVEIGELSSAGASPSDLLDQRDQALRQLSQLVEIRTHDGGNGKVRVTVAGNTIVGNSQAYGLEVTQDNQGELAFRVEGSVGFVKAAGGVIGGLLEFQNEFSPQLSDGLDELARNLIFETNRVHSVGVPSSGGYERLVSEHPVEDRNGNGLRTDELLANAGLPFEVQSGALHVNVSGPDGEVTKHVIEIDAARTTVGDLLGELNAIPSLSASLDPQGHLQVAADAGHRFDFSGRFASDADAIGAFGSGRGSLGTPAAEPFALSDGATLDLTGSGGPFSVTFQASDFGAIGEATAEEVAAVINADPNAQAAGVVASSKDGYLFLQTAGAGASQSFVVDGGSALGALGWSGQAGQTIQGSDNAVEPVLGGAYTGTGADAFTFVPTGDGVIGTTPGLGVEVYDANGVLVTTLDVGEDYLPGTELAVADGVTVAFGLGELSASQNDRFSVELTDDSDSTDVLVALGLGGYFTGTGAADIDVRRELELDPDLLATSATGAVGDNGVVTQLLAVQSKPLQDLDGLSLDVHYGQMVGTLGFEVSSTSQALEANGSLLSSLEQRQAQLSGVNVDEELVDMLEFEQAFQAAAQYLSVISSLADEVLNLL